MKRLRGIGGSTMMEYALILIVVGLLVVFIVTHLGASLRARYGASKSVTDMTKVDPNRHVEVDDQGMSGTAKSVLNQ